MKTSLLSSIVLATVLSLGAFGCASNTADDGAVANDAAMTARPKTINASTEERYGQLGGVWKVTGVDNEQGMDISIIETGGGDPAMNGNLPVLAAYGPDHGEGGVFDLGFNVRSIDSIKMTGPDTIELTGTQDSIDPKTDENISIAWKGTVKLTLVDNNIQPAVEVTYNDGSKETVQKATDSSSDFLYSLYSVDQKESPGGNIVRLFETGKGGDPAMNGGQLVLNIMSFPDDATFDLGLNINTVQSFDVTDTSITIQGTEDVMNANGDIVQRPFGYAIQYKIADFSVPTSIQMTRFK